jgi:2-methylisocitrate lyase-like PEP mutase family enzyme
VDVPVAADSEDCFAADPEGVAETVALLAATGLAGCSIEDFTRDRDDPIYEAARAAERVAAAAEAAHAGPAHLVLTARAENHLHGRDDLDDTIARLQAYQEAGADVLFAPGVHSAEDLRTILSSVDLPLNVLAQPRTPTVPELAELGVARISVGGAFAYAAYDGLIAAATELRDAGTYGYWERVAAARGPIRDAFT